jgi:hypothetical protein
MPPGRRGRGRGASSTSQMTRGSPSTLLGKRRAIDDLNEDD